MYYSNYWITLTIINLLLKLHRLQRNLIVNVSASEITQINIAFDNTTRNIER